MDEFIKTYDRLLRTAFQSAEQHILPLQNFREPFFHDLPHKRRFIAACHRGYEKAQNQIVQLLRDIGDDPRLSVHEKLYRELVLRKIVDGMALLILHGIHHVMRRLSTQYKAPRLSRQVIVPTLEEANRLNGESRQTFALLADLTTFIHVADILRVDFRSHPASYSLIELKSGRVNEMLLEKLEKYEPGQQSLRQIQEDPEIGEQYKEQAGRILRQRIRIRQIDEILSTDAGRDTLADLPLYLVGNEIETESFALFLDKLCDTALTNGKSAGTVDYCIHIGLGHSSDATLALKRASESLEFAIKRHITRPPNGLLEVFQEVQSLAPKADYFKTFNVLFSNLLAVPCEPLTLWGLKKDHLLRLISRDLCILICFDVASFIWLGRRLGLKAHLSSRKEAAEGAQKLGSRVVPRWDNRGVKIELPSGTCFVLGGMLSRFINELYSPLQFMQEIKKQAKLGPTTLC